MVGWVGRGLAGHLLPFHSKHTVLKANANLELEALMGTGGRAAAVSAGPGWCGLVAGIFRRGWAFRFLAAQALNP